MAPIPTSRLVGTSSWSSRGTSPLQMSPWCTRSLRHHLHRAATTAGAAASHRDQQKRTTYAWLGPNGYEFVPVSVESYGCLSHPAMKLMHMIGEEAADPGGVSRASCVEGALRELSVELVRGDYFLYRASVGMLPASVGHASRPGPQMTVVLNSVLADVLLLLSGLDGAACYQI
jgi:hypothetical protein